MEEIKETTEFKGKEITIGRALFNKCLLEDYPVVDESINKKKLSLILNDIAIKYSPSVVAETLDKVKNLGFMLSTLEGYTLSIDDLYSPELKEVSDALVGDVEQDMKTMSSEPVMDTLKSMSINHFIESGAKGSWEQVKQVVLSRGYISDATGNIRPNLIRNSLIQGLTPTEFFDSSWGARKGLLDTALSTGDSGYLTRQLIYSTVCMELGENEDCGTTDYLKLSISDAKMARSILWRYFKNEDGSVKVVSNSNYKSFIGKIIELRSPIYCTSRKICKKCYGNLWRILHSDQIGIIATQAVGEVSTQMVLRTFHLSGVAQLSKQYDQQEDIVSGMSIANKLFHKPRSLIGESTDPWDIVKMIYAIFSSYKSIHMIHYEVLVSAMLWYKDDPWRLIENRDSKEYEIVSILKVPARSSWLLGVAFSNLKTKLLEGLIDSKSDRDNSLTNLFRF